MSRRINRVLSAWTMSVALALLALVSTLVVSCTGSVEADDDTRGDATTSTTVESSPSSAPDVASSDAELDDEFLADLLAGVTVPDGAILFAVVDNDGTVGQATVGSDGNGEAPTPGDPFRVGSITKVFTAITILTLVDQDVIDLDSPAADYVTRLSLPADVTVRDLLRHRSGIYNVTDSPGFFDQVMGTPDRVWTPEAQMEMIADRDQVFERDSQFGYSNTNYLALGVLIEEVTGVDYHEVVRSRIIDPLGMPSTYLDGFEDGPTPFDPYEGAVPGRDGQHDYTSLASAAWAAGGMVSSASDLHRLFSALYTGDIVSAELLADMTAGDAYGLGVELSDWPNGLVGHGGAIPGYGAFVRYSVDSDVTAFFATTNPSINPQREIVAVVQAVAALD